MPVAPIEMEKKIKRVAKAWETLRADKSFAGMTLTQFNNKVKGSLDARNKIAGLENQITGALNDRDNADIVSNETIQLVVNAVKGDTDEGEDGELYEAMGYVRKSERRSGLARKTKPKPQS